MADEVIVALLNSTLIALWYRSRVLDSGQRAFPQVKVKDLRRLPLPPGQDEHVAVLDALTTTVRKLVDSHDGELERDANRLVCKLYKLTDAETELVLGLAPTLGA
jgi:hypothetical protein